MKVWRILSVCLLLVLAAPAFASMVQKSSGLGLARSGGNTAKGTVNQVGGDFGALLQKPANLSGGSSDFSRLLDMPFKLSDVPLDKATVKGVLTPKNIAKALRGGIGGYVAGEAFRRLTEAACVRLMGGSMQMTDSGAWEECVPGTTPAPSDGKQYIATAYKNKGATWRDSTLQACLDGLVLATNADATTRFVYTRVNGTTCYADWYDKKTGAPGFKDAATVTLESRTSPCPIGQYVWADGTCHAQPDGAATYRPTTTDAAQTALENAIKLASNAANVWDSMRDYADKGGQFDMDSPLAVTGPAQSPASVSTTQSTQTTSTGSQTLTTTNTTVNNYNYAGDTITVNQVTTSVTRNEAGQVVSSTTTTKNPDSVDEAPSDTPLPPVPDLYVRKYPNGMEGIYNEYKGQLKGTPVAQLAKQLMPNIGDGGTCPSWPFNLNLEVWALYGVHDVAPPCWIWGVGKAILILSALLLARSLIFGG